MTNERYLDAALRIGRRLCGEAIWSGARCNWLGDAMEYAENDWRVVHRSAGPTLYDGTSGIALFLSHLASATGDAIVRDTSRGALRQAVDGARELAPPGRLGFYSGLPGIGTALIACGTLLGDEAYLAGGTDMLASLAIDTDDGLGLDVIGGAAGAIPALLAHGTIAARDLAVALGERLITTARHRGATTAWDTMPGSTHPLTGYSHGTAGIAVALAELFAATGESRWNDLALRALEHEREHFVAAEGNWPDFRTMPGRESAAPDGPVCASAWCHGAPGIALGRLRMVALGHEATVRSEANVALGTTQKHLTQLQLAPRYDATPCHGLAGHAEPLIVAAHVLRDETHLTRARAMADLLIERYLVPRATWPCGVPGGGETPALLTGLSGIGYFMLRVWQPDRIPSILLPGSLGSPLAAGLPQTVVSA